LCEAVQERIQAAELAARREQVGHAVRVMR
jgi:hypothetical protein